MIKKTGSQQEVNQNGHEYTTTQNRIGDTSTVVYDSLNTREQTGYYNMGRINQYGGSRPDTTVDSPQQASTTVVCPQQTAANGDSH
ncbi:hypothetical protein SNE40_019415 [Patella caerulea]|uniref:Uncharacterized protein n=1 Tax=Patella caerulea TaxID=87958 RepID=A0AAN8J6G4_PATCE